MTTAERVIRLDSTSAETAVSRAVACLQEGLLLIMPTETVYGVAAAADDPGAVKKLREIGRLGTAPLTWHASSREDVLSRLGQLPRVHQRLLTKFLPGPTRFVIELDAARLGALRHDLGVGVGVIDDGVALDVRVPMLPIVRRVLDRVDRPIVMIRLAATGIGADGGLDPRAEDLDDRIGCVLSGGGTLYAKGSTTVRLHAGGGFEIEHVGAVPESDVMEAAERILLFVCTGNTCRSPMAAALAEGMIEQSKDDLITIESAGIATADGMSATAEAVETMRRLGFDISGHRTRLLTRKQCAKADAIFVMTAAHRARVLEIDPGADGKTYVLDPVGDVQDPIGLPLAAYEATARQLRALIEQRLKELSV